MKYARPVEHSFQPAVACAEAVSHTPAALVRAAKGQAGAAGSGQAG